jgi:hypothetical protein
LLWQVCRSSIRFPKPNERGDHGTYNTIPLRTIFRGCYWFLACEVVIMSPLMAFPQISLWLPGLLN